MKRGWATVSDENQQGTQESVQLGQALAAICEPELMRSLLAAFSAMNQWGGQFVVAAQRNRFKVAIQRDDMDNAFEVLQQADDGPIHKTVGYVLHWQHIPDVLKDAIKEPSTELGHVEFPEPDKNGDEPIRVGDDVPEEEPLEQPPVEEPTPEEAKA